MSDDLQTLSPPVRQTLAQWHRFVETRQVAVLEPLFAETAVFRSPFVHRPIVGRAGCLLVLGAVVQVFENFRYHRIFTAGSHDVGLEFSAKIGDLDLKGIDLVAFDADGLIVDFEVMVRPIKALQALGAKMGERIGPQLAAYKAAAPA
jgi:hypothetical protein